MSYAPSQTSRRQLSFSDQRRKPEASNYLQLALDSLNHLIEQSEQQIAQEQQVNANEDHQSSRELDQVQKQIDTLNNESEQLTLQTCTMLVRHSEAVLIRHNKLLKETIEQVNQVLGKRSVANDPVFEQLRKDMQAQQEKLFLVRNQLDIDHNQLSTNISLLKECQEQRKQLVQSKLQKQSTSKRRQQNHDVYLQKQLRLQSLLEQQKRIRQEIQHLAQYEEPIDEPQRDHFTNTNSTKQARRPIDDHKSDIVDDDTTEGIRPVEKQSAAAGSRLFVRMKEQPQNE